MIIKYKITKEFINFRNERANKFKSNGRNRRTQLIHADCELAEVLVSHLGLQEKSNVPNYDTISEKLGKCEYKCINNSGNVTIKYWCSNQNFKHFILWKFLNLHDEPLKEGDEGSIQICEIVSKKDLMNRAQISQYSHNLNEPDYYARAKNSVQITENML